MTTIRTILFDLDGTLLDYDITDDFIPAYFRLLTQHLAPYVAPETFMHAMNQGVAAIAANDGSCTNETAFAEIFYPLTGKPQATLEPAFTEFYRHEFGALQRYIHRKPAAQRVMQTAFDLGYEVVIATNPFFPAVATQQRLAWAGVEDFPYRKVTTYENSHFAKPDLRYYGEILTEFGWRPEKTLMVGDEAMDMVAGQLGCSTFLVRSPATKPETLAPPPTYTGTLDNVAQLLREIETRSAEQGQASLLPQLLLE